MQLYPCSGCGCCCRRLVWCCQLYIAFPTQVPYNQVVIRVYTRIEYIVVYRFYSLAKKKLNAFKALVVYSSKKGQHCVNKPIPQPRLRTSETLSRCAPFYFFEPPCTRGKFPKAQSCWSSPNIALSIFPKTWSSTINL